MLTDVESIQCGVLIPGHLINGLLEEGTESWQDGILPYSRNNTVSYQKEDVPYQGVDVP
jgi:tyrosyl-DNA phosphodiesterase 1